MPDDMIVDDGQAEDDVQADTARMLKRVDELVKQGKSTEEAIAIYRSEQTTPDE